MGAKATAVKKWTEWRVAAHQATDWVRPSEVPDDPLLVMLRSWWKEQGLPSSLDELTEQDATQVLLKINELDWACRPFTAEPSAPRSTPPAAG